jgi:SAM-dependent methyltransferase
MKDTEETNTITLFILEGADAYNRWIFEKIRFSLGKEIFEVGCGIGNLTGLLLSQGNVIAADVNEEYLQTVENKYQNHPNLKGVFTWDIRKNPPEHFSISIDTIVCSNVLEHIENDDFALRKFWELLPVNGRLIVLVPAVQALYNVLDKELGHFRRYNKKELNKKLIRNGFKVCSLKYFNLFGMVGWFMNGTLLRRRLLPVNQMGVFNKMVPLFMKFEKVIPMWKGQSLIAIAKKT